MPSKQVNLLTSWIESGFTWLGRTVQLFYLTTTRSRTYRDLSES
jgi:hypothetical protein